MAAKVILSNDTIKAGVTFVSADNKARESLLPRFVDLLWADGVRTVNVRAKGDDGKPCTENDALRNQIKEVVIIPGFPKAEQALLEKETKTLSDMDKFLKDRVKKKIGPYMTRFESEIKKREEDELIAAGLIEPRVAKTDAQKLQKVLDEIIGKYQKLENPVFDVTECVKLLKQVKTLTPAV